MSHASFAHSPAPTSAYTRHRQAVSAHLTLYNGQIPKQAPIRTERDILEENHRFIRPDDEDTPAPKSQDDETLLAQKYYAKLYKEYALVGLSQWREGLIALRWRTKNEVLNGKGEEVCGALGCVREGTETVELNFGYVEEGERRNALVKVRVCGRCKGKVGEVERIKERRRREGREKRRERRRRSESPRQEGRREKRRRERSVGVGEGEVETSRGERGTAKSEADQDVSGDRAQEDQHDRRKHRSRHRHHHISSSRPKSQIDPP